MSMRIRMPGQLLWAAAMVLAMVFAEGSAWAQSTQEQSPPDNDSGPVVRTGPQSGQRVWVSGPNGEDLMWGPDDAFGFVGFEAGFAGKTVTGAPFTANISTQVDQKLADGNRIERKTSGTIARDSQGRTRHEMTLPAIGPWAVTGNTPPHVVFISDPVAGATYMLNPARKRAHSIGRRIWNPGKDTPGIRSATKIPEGKEATADLGKKPVNGVPANGTRVTQTIPAGAIGNEKPIKIVTERWYSPDLQMNILVKRSDPRMGETIFQLTDIQRKEPDASLFQVPSDYTVTKGAPGGGGRFGGMRGRSQQPPSGENEPGDNGPGETPPPPQPPQQ